MPRQQLRHTVVQASWLKPFITRAYNVRRKDELDYGVINPVEKIPGQAWKAVGPIGQHKDPDFGPISYILILRAAAGVELFVRGYEPLKLKPNMIVEFPCRRQHGLRQRPKEIMVWCGQERAEPQPWDAVLEQFKEAMKPKNPWLGA